MKWLADFVDVADIDIKDYCDKLTLTGSKVEGFEKMGEEIENVVVAKIKAIAPHPDSDHLLVCQMDVGTGTDVQIVTGAQNVFEGAIVPAALPVAKLPGGVVIKDGKLRGVESHGMLCSMGELKLTTHECPGKEENGILILDECFEDKIGTDIREVLMLDDTTVEFEITSNRPDCLSVIGLARETAASFDRKLTLPTPKVKGCGDGDDVNKYLSVGIEAPDLCYRYAAKVVKNVRIAPSPMWLRMRLAAAGVRPINNIVDITNYVMLEYGQPMHAFDYKCLDGKAIVVRNAKDGEVFKTLDDQDRNLDSEMLVIADAYKSVAVAGVMGGANSEITDETKTVVFESANFKGANVRHTTKKLGMRTDASSRFEKGLDACLTVPALDRACQLVEMLGAGEIVEGVIDVNNDSRERRVIKLDIDWVNKFLGTDISKEFMINSLKMLDFEIDDRMNVTVPSFRDDVEDKADLAEEIVRLYGYNEIPTTLVNMETTQGMLTPKQKLSKDISETLLAQGASEICTYSFVSPKIYDKLHYPADDIRRQSVIISNPLGEDTSIMRTTSAASMLSTLALNYNNRNESVCMFEPATVYIKLGDDNTLPHEKVEFCIGSYGEDTDFFSLKGIVENTLATAGVSGAKYIAVTQDPTFHPGRTAQIVKGDDVIGIIGEVHPEVCKEFGLGTKAYLAILDFDVILANSDTSKEYKPLPKFPATTRDLAVLAPKAVTVAEISDIIEDKAKGILESVKLFDVYSGAQIPDGYISLAFALVFRAADRTLNDEEIDAKIKKIVKSLAEIGVSIRS